MVGNKPQSLSVLQIQANKVGGNTRNSLPARTKKYRFSTAEIQEGDVGEANPNSTTKVTCKQATVRMGCGFIV